MIHCPYCKSIPDNEIYRHSMLWLKHYICSCKCTEVAFEKDKLFYFRLFVFTGKNIYYLYAYHDNDVRLFEPVQSQGFVTKLPVTWKDLSLWNPIELAEQINTILAFQ